MKRFILLLTLLVFATNGMVKANQTEIKPDEIITYKSTEQGDLNLHIFYPENNNSKNRTLIISFFGGGWISGKASQFYEQSEYYNSLGIVAISAEYRIASKHNTTPFECVKDGKSAIRWARANAEKLGIDPNKILLSGGSAGGHVASATAIIEGCDEPTDDLSISTVPNGLILFNPVIDTSEKGYGASRLVGQETVLSPVHHVTEKTPPTIIFHGTCDTTVPCENAIRFDSIMASKGNVCRLFTFIGEQHGFFNSPSMRPIGGDRNFKSCMRETTSFLFEQGFITSAPEIKADPIRIACVGNSITHGARLNNRETESYPANLQRLVGDRYEVKNFGVSGTTLLSSGNKPYIKTDAYKELLKYESDIVIIKLGTNDSKSMNWSNHDSFVEDYNNLIKSINDSSVRKPTIFLSLPAAVFNPNSTPNINDSIIRTEVIPLIELVAKENNIRVIDTYTPFVGREDLFPDKVHPNAYGAKLLAGTIYEQLTGFRSILTTDDISVTESTKGIIDPSNYHTMRGGLKYSQDVFRKTKKGTVAFLGGSITHNDGWRDMVSSYLERKFPDTEFTFVAAGIPSQGTTSGAFRFDRDINSAGKIDLLFEEAAVNDRDRGELRRTSPDRVKAMEGIIRKARKNNPKMDIVIMNFVDPNKMKDYRSNINPIEIVDFDLVADHYDIPTINLAKEVTDRIDGGEFTWEHDFVNLHPAPLGQKVYYRSMFTFLERAFAESLGSDSEYKLPSMIDANCYDNARLVSINEAKLSKGWSIDPSWSPKEGEKFRPNTTEIPYLVAEGSSKDLTLKFKGRAVGFVNLSGNDAGTIEYSIDGGEYKTFDLWTTASGTLHIERYFMLENELDATKNHTLKIRLGDAAAIDKKSKGNACRISSFLIND